MEPEEQQVLRAKLQLLECDKNTLSHPRVPFLGVFLVWELGPLIQTVCSDWPLLALHIWTRPNSCSMKVFYFVGWVFKYLTTSRFLLLPNCVTCVNTLLPVRYLS